MITRLTVTQQHATTSVPKKEGLEDVHVVFTGDKSVDQRAMFTPSFLWHSDVSRLFMLQSSERKRTNIV